MFSGSKSHTSTEVQSSGFCGPAMNRLGKGKPVGWGKKMLPRDGWKSKNRGTPKWMEFLVENPIKMDDLGVPPFSETPIYPP